ncbi:MAG TPA: hypothetical protein G4N99_09290 [Thermoflexia bacterium]|nr:hypothetical protein [Thermoflexia bacterium]
MSTETFWAGAGVYNEKTLPVQVILTIVAALSVYRVFTKPGDKTNVLVKTFLSFAFAWNGATFFLIFVRNPISTFIGAPLFIVVTILFAVDIFARKTNFRLPEAGWKRRLTALWILLAFSYPLIGWALLGHAYPRILMPMFPCPLTVFALALIAAAAPNVGRKVSVDPKCYDNKTSEVSRERFCR